MGTVSNACLCREQKGQGEWVVWRGEGVVTYHTLPAGTDTVGVPVAAARPIVDHLVHEDHIPRVL